MKIIKKCCNLLIATCTLLFSWATTANIITVTNESGQPLANVMVMQTPVNGYNLDTSDMGYPPEKITNHANMVYTLFTNNQGKVSFNTYQSQQVRIRLRLPEHHDVTLEFLGNEDKSFILKPITDALALAESRPANTWLAALDFSNKTDTDNLKQHYVMQCGFCHQQGSHFFRRPRPEDNWQEIVHRMVGYGSRLHSDAQEALPKVLSDEYARVYNKPELIPQGTPWKNYLQQAKITEWPIGDAFSQMHDLLYHSNGLVYVGDNLQDRLYEINPKNGEFVIYKLKRESSDKHGGLMGKRLSSFPKHEAFAGIHSFAESAKDGHIFITTSYQQRLVEFDPVTKEFINHKMDEGYYPHTVRVDQQDRVWFTMALSNQIAMLDRKTNNFTLFDLPNRSMKEGFTVSAMGIILKLMDWGLPLANWFPIDEQSSGVPLPYGIDITPNGNVWFVDKLKLVNSANEEIKALDSLNTKKEAVIRIDELTSSYNSDYITVFEKDSISNISLSKYDVTTLTYQTKTEKDQFAVFSEIYYKDGWNAYLDGELATHLRVNYVLRGMFVPAGNHTIEFRFEPKVIQQGKIISLTSYGLLLLISLGWFFYEKKQTKED